jgi:outer membrane protein assembly factor BamB
VRVTRISWLYVLAVAAAMLALAAPAAAQSSKAWSQFRDNPQGTAQNNVVGAQSSRPEPGFPVALPGAPGAIPGSVAVGLSGVAFVGQGSSLSAYSPSGNRFWTYTAPNAGGDAPPTVTAPALSLSGSTVYALSVTFNLFTSPSSSLIALNAATGGLRWSARSRPASALPSRRSRSGRTERCTWRPTSPAPPTKAPPAAPARSRTPP